MKTLPRWVWRAFWAILLFAFLSRAWRLNTPNAYYFDEVYHAVTAKLILHNDPRAYEWWNEPPEPHTAVDWLHPPLAKYTQAVGMMLLGENGAGWRVSSVVFGTGTVVLIFLLTLALGLGAPTALLAMSLFALDGLALTTSRIAMNDAHVTFFFVLTILSYTHWKANKNQRWAIATAIAAGLSVASKWSGLFVVGIIGLDQLRLALLHWQEYKKIISQSFTLAGYLSVLVPIIYILGYSQMFFQGKNWDHFYQLHKQTWWYQTHLEATHPYQSTPIEWVLNLRPVYVYADYSQPGELRNIYMLGNPLIFWGGALAAIWSLGDLIGFYRRKKLKSALVSQRNALALLLIAYGFTWMPWMASPRIMFFYHYLPALPFLTILLSHQLLVSWNKKVVIGFVFLSALLFALFYPNWTGIGVPQVWGRFYFLMPNWR